MLVKGSSGDMMNYIHVLYYNIGGKVCLLNVLFCVCRLNVQNGKNVHKVHNAIYMQ